MNDVTTSPDTTLTIKRTFNASRARVFAAFTDASSIRRWMGPPGSEVTDASFDARVGGAYRVVMQSPNYGEMIVQGTVTALREPEHLAYTWAWVEDDGSLGTQTLVEIDFVAHGDTTEMIFTQHGFESVESRDRHIDGWNGAFSNIAGLF